MKIAVRYQSRLGHTRAVAEVIAEVTGVKAEPLSTPLDEDVDVLFLGGGVYMWDADHELLEYLKNLRADKIKQIAAFSTSGCMTKAIKRITEYANAAGIKVNESIFCLKYAFQVHTSLKIKGGKLSEKQFAEIKEFANKVVNDF